MAKVSLGHSSSFTFNTFLRILAVPNKIVFYNNLILMVIPYFPNLSSNILLTTPSAPTTTGATSLCLIPHSFLISLFICCLHIFCSLSCTLWTPGEARSTIIAFFSSFSRTIISSLSSGFDELIVLDIYLRQDLNAIIFRYPFWFVLVPLLTCVYLVPTTELPVDLSCNIIIVIPLLIYCSLMA